MTARTTTRPAPDDALGMMARARGRDPLGDKAHVALIAAMMFMLPLGTAPLSFMSAIAVGYSLLRLWATAPAVGYLIRLPIVWVFAALLAWTLVSLTWSPDRAQGWDEAAILRYQIPLLIAIWPVIDRWRMFVWALACGTAVAALIQIGQWTSGNSWPLFLWWHNERITGRFPGLLHPTSTGFIAVAVLWLLVLLRPTTAGQRLAAGALMAAATISLALTGSRSGWIAALCGAVAALPLMGRAWRTATGRMRIAALVAVLAAALGGLVLGPQIVGRVRSAITDLQAAIQHGDYSGDVAARWRQIEFSRDMISRHPLTGVGAGGYLVTARRCVADHAAEGIQVQQQSGAAHHSTGVLAHPHSALLYAGAVLGLPGVAMFLSIWLVGAREMFWRPVRDPRLAWAPVLAAFFVGFGLDSHNLSDPGMILLTFILAIAAYKTRRISPWNPSSDTDREPRNNQPAGVARA